MHGCEDFVNLLYLSCIIASREAQGGLCLLNSISVTIDCASMDVFLPSPAKVRMCGAIHID